MNNFELMNITQVPQRVIHTVLYVAAYYFDLSLATKEPQLKLQLWDIDWWKCM